MNRPINISDPGFQIDAPLALAQNEVHLWRVDLDAIRGNVSRWEKILSAGELVRAARFHFSGDRERYMASRAGLRMILAAYLAIKPNALNFSYSKKEKPFLGPEHASSNVTFNLSHSGGIAVFAFTRRWEIGVDVEQVRTDFDIEAIARRFFSAHEQKQLSAVPGEKRFEAFFRCWTRKEAYIKATGDGLSLPLHEFDVSVAAGDCDALLSTRPDPSEAAHWSLREVPAGKGYVAALCVRSRELQLKDWASALPD